MIEGKFEKINELNSFPQLDSIRSNNEKSWPYVHDEPKKHVFLNSDKMFLFILANYLFFYSFLHFFYAEMYKTFFYA